MCCFDNIYCSGKDPGPRDSVSQEPADFVSACEIGKRGEAAADTVASAETGD